MRFVVYALCEPGGTVRYIGSTRNPAARWAAHKARRSGAAHAWLTRQAGAKMETIGIFYDREEALTFESVAIDSLKGTGAHLFNRSDPKPSPYIDVSRATRRDPCGLSTDGRSLLAAFLSEHGVGVTAAAADLRVSHPALIAWLVGRTAPSYSHRKSIEIWTDGYVPFLSWPASRTEAARLGAIRPVGSATLLSRESA